MSLLTICQGASDETKIARPATIVGNTNPEAQTILRLANKVGYTLMKCFPWQVLTKEQTFTSVATEAQTSILPSDFDRFCKETFWDRTAQIFINGPITNVEWQGLKAGAYSDAQNPKMRLRGDSVLILPTMDAGNTLAFEYISKNWCQSSGGTAQAAWAADSDTGILPEELLTRGLIYEWLSAEGLPSAEAAESYKNYFDDLVENDQPDGGTLLSGDIFGGSRVFSGVPTLGIRSPIQ